MPFVCAGPVADALNLNAGVALAAAQVANSPAEGVAIAQEVSEWNTAASHCFVTLLPYFFYTS